MASRSSTRSAKIQTPHGGKNTRKQVLLLLISLIPDSKMPQKSITSFFGTSSPKSSKRPAADGENASPNKKAKGDETENKGLLTPDQKKRMESGRVLCRLLRETSAGGALHSNIGRSWFEALRPVLESDGFASLGDFVRGERASGSPVYPPPEDVWSWTRHFDVRETRVVILGQDPYHGPKQAHGLCFSVRRGVKPPPSLVNMFQELETDSAVTFTRPSHGDLTGWARQGVLLLNACLTVRGGAANSHSNRGWERVTDAAVKAVSDKCPNGVVFLLWGSYAQKKAAAVNGKRHHLLKSTHPSPLSAHRGFLGCGHFSKCNELLVKSGKKPIDWGDLN